jgi:adenosylhomocysteine nucleosidase
MIAVLYATEKEARPLLDRVQAVPVEDATFPIFSARIADVPLLIAIGGMGMPAAAAACRHLVQRHHVDTILNVGICAGLADHMTMGTLYTVDAAFMADTFLSDTESSPVGEPVTAWPGIAAKRLGSVSEPLFDATRREAIAAQCDLVDMEGAAVARACRELGVTCHLLKGVSDDARPGSRDTLLKQLKPVSERLAAQVIQDIAKMSSFAESVDRNNLVAGVSRRSAAKTEDRVSGSVKGIRRSVSVKKASKCALPPRSKDWAFRHPQEMKSTHRFCGRPQRNCRRSRPEACWRG